MKQLLFSVLVSVLFFPATLFAQSSYSTLIDGTPLSDTNDIGQYLNSIYMLAIVAAALFAVVKIIIAGVKYMLSDVVTSKEDAKKDIRTSLLGLIIIISAVLILNTINPNLTDFGLKFVKPEKLGLAATPLIDDFDNWETPACVGRKTTQEGRYETISINTTTCDDTVSASSLERFTEICGDYGGTMEKREDDIYVCKRDFAADRFKLSEYSASSVWINWVDFGFINVELMDQYATWNRNVLTYDGERYCREQESADEYEVCLDSVENLFTVNNRIGDLADSYCENNGGRSTPPFTCELPTQIYTYEQALKDAKRSAPDTVVNGALPENAYRQMCTAKFGTHSEVKSTRRTWANGLSDTMCVTFQTKPATGAS